MAKAALPRPSEARQVVEHFRAQPVAFSRTVLGADPWSTSEEILRALAVPRARVAVRACHASSKTHTASQAALWFVATGGKVVTTAPTWRQVKDLLWREIATAYAGARFPIGGRLTTTQLELSPDVFAVGVSTKDEVNFQGFHGERVLVILDEAPGVRPAIWNAIAGIRAGGDVRVLAIGNPWGNSGPYYEAFTRQGSTWIKFRINAFDTPNLAGVTVEQLRTMGEADLDICPRPYLIGRRQVKEFLEDWGEDSPLWMSKVLGEFPPMDPLALIAFGLIETARVSEAEPAEDDPIEAGVDVAEGGEDETVVCVRRGPRVLQLVGFAKRDPRGEVAALLGKHREAGNLKAVKVDKIGVGAYFGKHLRDLGFPVVEINVGEAPRNKERYINLRAELYDGLRARFEHGNVSGLTDDRAITQLSGIRFGYRANGQMYIESKEDARKRGIKSPDRADAIMLAFAAAKSSLVRVYVS